MTAEAGPPANPGNKPGNKPGGKKPTESPGKGPTTRPTPPAKGGNAVVAKISGAGQRLHFSFGGELTLRRNNRLHGDFVIVAHPLAPLGNVISVSCRYRRFTEAKLENNTVSFVGTGQCTRLERGGKLTTHETTNEFRMADHGESNDVIEAKLTSPMGLTVPIGTLNFGNLTIDREPS
jgi:hypothetical protein